MRQFTNILSFNFSFLMRKSAFIFLLITMFSCDESEFLRMKPLDFYSIENSYAEYSGFEAALNHLYASYRDNFYMLSRDYSPAVIWMGTDLAFHAHGTPGGDFPNYSNVLVPANNFIYDAIWRPCYQIIYDANVINSRADGPQSQLTEEQKILVKAEARFFRAYAYKMLADLYGGVPLVLEETTSPKRDYVRSSRQEVYEQCVLDLDFAAKNLKNINEVADSRISDLVAYHVLSEVYISLENWEQAINAASIVIDSPHTSLMTERFGTRVGGTLANGGVVPDIFPWAKGGDVYWDLFRKGNQNRSSGNKEALWVLQYEYNVPGGSGGGFFYEHFFSPRLWQTTLFNDNGLRVNITPHANTYYGGRSGGFFRLTKYFYHDLWEKSGFDDDIRNSEFNIVRDFLVNNPASDYNGKWILKDNVPISLTSFVDTIRNFYPLITKTTSMGDHPDDMFIPDQTIPGSITEATGVGSNLAHRDDYRIRLAETYLLRAEAYLGNGNKINAAEDINVVRRRAKAPDVDPSEVDIDYILDERLRELYAEEFRLFTLTRLGKLVERAKKYNPAKGNTYAEHNNLWPIPYSEIEKNTGAILEQNPGY